MKNGLRLAAISAAMLAGLAITGVSRTDAGVSFSGTFPLPHGVISIGIGDPQFPVGAYVPGGYRICARDDYGYGFMYGDRWIPVRRYGTAWRVYDRPWYNDVYYSDAYYGGSYYTGRFSPRYHRGDNYAYRRHDGGGWNEQRYHRQSDRNQGWNNQGHDRYNRNDRNDRGSRERSRGDNRQHGNGNHGDRNSRPDHRQHDADRP